MLILRETDFIEDIIENGNPYSNKVLSMSKLIYLLCKYYKNYEEVANALIGIYKEDEGFYIEKYDTLILKKIKDILKDDLELIDYDFIPIYESDIKLVEELDTNKERKILFTAIVLSRYYNNNGWLGTYSAKEFNEWFKLANVSESGYNKYFTIHSLMKRGCLSNSKMNTVTNLNLKTLDQGKVVMKITKLENIGNQYISNFISGYVLCGNCGKIFKRKSCKGRPPKWCDKCAYDIKLSQIRGYKE